MIEALPQMLRRPREGGDPYSAADAREQDAIGAASTKQHRGYGSPPSRGRPGESVEWLRSNTCARGGISHRALLEQRCAPEPERSAGRSAGKARRRQKLTFHSP